MDDVLPYQDVVIQEAFPETALIGEANVLSNLALNYRSLGHYDRAIETHDRALEIYRASGNQRGEVISLNNLSIVYNLLSQHRQSIELREQSLAIAQEIGYRQAEAASLGGLANDYYELQEYERAVEFYNQALNIFQDIGDRVGEGHALHGLGIAHYYLDHYDQAIDFYQQGLLLYRETGYLASTGDLLIALGITYDALGEYTKAIDFYQQALDLVRDIGYRGSEADALNNLGLVYLQLEQPETAEGFLTLAVDILDALRASGLADAAQISLLQRQQRTFQLLQRALVDQTKYGAALEVAERGRTRAFTALMTRREAPAAVTENKSLQLTEMTALAQQLETTLVEYSIVRISELDDPVLYIWVVSTDGELEFRQQSLKGTALGELVQNSRRAIGVRGRGFASTFSSIEVSRTPSFGWWGDPTDELAELYNLLIDPIAELLPDDPEAPVVFVPQGELFLLPFPALVNSNGDYLLEQHTLLTSPSIQVLSLTEKMAASKQTHLSFYGIESLNAPLIVGNPTMPTVVLRDATGRFTEEPLPDLPGAGQEAEDIATFLNTSALTSDGATESVVKQRLNSAELIHLATHGLLEYGDPTETGSQDTPGAVALAPGLGEDGLLTTAEILQMDLQASLVVLSACDTGRGRITGDGVIGLSRAFVAAGVPSLVVSLWSVPDAPTAELMTEFYRQLSQGQTKAQALRQAMLMTMEIHQHPMAWAAFTLVGAN
ncbi:MAG: CHAT domain-containing protein [Leptolyngbya sp. SIO3F4]|nr:CHAT domain-containing protein [Leptolyngbya sp. SIO3F4]